jgi:hypothetical protein
LKLGVRSVHPAGRAQVARSLVGDGVRVRTRVRTGTSVSVRTGVLTRRIL